MGISLRGIREKGADSYAVVFTTRASREREVAEQGEGAVSFPALIDLTLISAAMPNAL